MIPHNISPLVMVTFEFVCHGALSDVFLNSQVCREHLQYHGVR